MAGKIRVTPDAQPAQWSAAAPGGAGAGEGAGAPPSSGAEILEQNACTACHSIDGSESTAPTFKGLYGTKRTLESGQTVVVDDAYIAESVTAPEAKVVKGFEPVMPPSELTPAEMNALLDYLRTLK
jgi:cytochrome c oxidase subunit 2